MILIEDNKKEHIENLKSEIHDLEEELGLISNYNFVEEHHDAKVE